MVSSLVRRCAHVARCLISPGVRVGRRVALLSSLRARPAVRLPSGKHPFRGDQKRVLSRQRCGTRRQAARRRYSLVVAHDLRCTPTAKREATRRGYIALSDWHDEGEHGGDAVYFRSGWARNDG